MSAIPFLGLPGSLSYSRRNQYIIMCAITNLSGCIMGITDCLPGERGGGLQFMQPV